MKVLKVLKMFKVLFEHLAPFAGPAAVSPMGARPLLRTVVLS
jgi:hypothetical protein